MKRLAIAVLAVLALGAVIAGAQVVTNPAIPPNTVCAYNTSPPTLTNGQASWLQCDASGNLLTTAGGGGVASSVIILPTASAAAGIAPVVSVAAEGSHVLKASAGNVYSAYATNFTATAGYLVLLNLTAAPADGAITPLACALLSPNGIASINYAPGPPGVFSTGITAVVTSAATCFTKTTGTITAFISGSVQ